MLRLESSNDRVVAVRQFVQIFCILLFEDVTPRELDLLCEIIYANGEVSGKAKKNYLLNYKVSERNYGQVIYRLSKKEILISKSRSTGKLLHPAFQMLLNFIENPEKNHNHIMIKWKTE